MKLGRSLFSRLQNKSQSTKQIKLGDNIEIDCASLSGQCAQGKLEFTPREMKVLECLYEHRGKTIDPENPQFLKQVGDGAYQLLVYVGKHHFL